MTYTYDPTQMMDEGKNQMRFELGDTQTDGAPETCALSDEEYTAIIEKVKSDGRGFRYAKLKCLEAICMKMAYEVDFSADGMSMSLSQRYERWKKLLHEMQAEYQQISANPAALGKNRLDGGHYFYAGMHDNTRVHGQTWPFRDV